MVGLLEFRQKLKMIYAEYSAYIIPVVKFFMVFMTLTVMNDHIGYMDRLNSTTIVLLVSLVCCILPSGASTFFVSLFLLAHLSSLSIIAAGVALVVLLIMFCTYYIFQPKDSILLYLVPVAFVFKIPYAVPMVMGLVGGFFSAIPVCFGVILYYMVRWIKANTSILGASSQMEPLQQLMEMVTSIMKNREMVVFMIAFAATVFVVYLIRRLSVKYCWEIAIGVGSLVNVLIILAGSSSLDLDIGMGSVLLGVIAAALIALGLMIFVFWVDFNRAVRTQFEDDEYYYYVKAVPKVTLAPRQKKVKKIASSKKRAEQTEQGETGQKAAGKDSEAGAAKAKVRKKKRADEPRPAKLKKKPQQEHVAEHFSAQEEPVQELEDPIVQEEPIMAEEPVSDAAAERIAEREAASVEARRRTDEEFESELAEMAAEFAELDADL